MKKCLFLSLLIPALLMAQESETPPVELPPLQVLSNPTETRLPTFSTSISSFSGEELEQRQALHLQDSFGLIPNLNFAGATSRPRFLQLRGIGETSRFSGEGPPNFSVGILQDEIDLSALAGAISLFDIDSLNVLRGPQPTLYGSRALAGLLVVNSRAPTRIPETLVQVSAGSDSLFNGAVAHGGPISAKSDNLFYRLTLEWNQQDGFRDNVFLDRNDTNDRKEFNGRLQFLFEPSATTTHHLTLMSVYQDNGYDQFAPVGDGFTMYSDEPGEDTLTFWGGSLRSVYGAFEKMDLISITSGSTADTGYGYDADWGNDAFWAAPPYNFDPAVEGFRYSFTEQLDRERNQLSQEFRLLNKENNRIFNGSTDWSLGAVLAWLDEEESYQGFSSLESDYEALTSAIYGQITTSIADDLDFVGSLRLENRASDYSDDSGVNEDIDDLMTGGRIALEARPSESSNAFIGLARGFKGGGVNANPNLSESQRVYDPETAWNLEGGGAVHWADGRGRASLTLFHMWREDLQVGTSIQPDPSDPTTFTFFTDNAAEGVNYGAELEVQQPLAENVLFFGSLGLLETEFEDFQDAGGSLNIEGRDQPHAPNYTFLAGMEWEFVQDWTARVELEGKDAYYFSSDHDQRSEAYQLLHLSCRYEQDTWSISFWARNVTDEDYDTRGFFFGLTPPDYPDQLWTSKGDPAQFGMTLRVSY